MDLEKINKEYTKLKNDLEKMEKEIEALDKRANDLADDKILKKGYLIQAQRMGSKADENKAKAEIKKIDDELKRIAEDATNKKEDVKKIKDKIEEKVKEIKEDPKMKKHLGIVLAKQYSRKISNSEKEKEKLNQKKERLTELNELVKKHPSLGNNLIGIIGSANKIKELEKELKNMTIEIAPGVIDYKDPARADEIQNTLIPQYEAKLETNKSSLMAYIEKKSLNITKKDIEEIAENGVIDGKGNVDLKATMNKSIASLNRQTKGLEKSIANYKLAYNSLDAEYRKAIPLQRQQSQGQPSQGQPAQGQPSQDGEEKPKWYQFIKRFKNWNEKRKQKALPDGNTSPSDSAKAKEDNEFKDSLKYKIVSDLVDKMNKDNVKEAKKQVKSKDSSR